MNKYPTVSIIIPVYNAQNTFQRCLESIKELDYPSNKIEIIVIDNGSTDKSVEVAEKFTSNILIEPDLSVGGLRNKGANIASSEILAFTDSDCLVDKNWLKSAVHLLSENSSSEGGKSDVIKCTIGVVTGRIDIPKDAPWVTKTWALNRGKKQLNKTVNWASSMNMILSRSLFLEVNGFSESLITCEDVDLSGKIIKTDHHILYSEYIMVTHLGEAENLAQLYKKEYWRGNGAFSLLKGPHRTLRDWRYFTQVSLFTLSFLAGVASIFLSSILFFIIFLGGHISLPLLRAIHISFKNKSLNSFLNLFCVWYIYYWARSLSYWR